MNKDTKRKIRDFKKKARRHFYKYINGTKGVISLFLAILMTPLLSLAMVLVEGARYQHALEIVEEVADLSANSTLAGYDSYLDERFALLAVDQESSVGDQFDKYMKANASTIGNHATYTSGTITGEMALSDLKILKQQITEAGELAVPIETLYQGFDIDGMIERFVESKEQLDKMGKQAKKIKSMTDFLEKFAKVEKACLLLATHYNTYTSKLSAYQTAYSNMEKEIYTADTEDEDYITVLKAAIDGLPANAAEDAEFDVKEVKDKYKTVSEKVTAYKTAAEELKAAIETLQSDVGTLLEDLPAVLDAAESIEEGEKGLGMGLDILEELIEEDLVAISGYFSQDMKDSLQTDMNNLDEQIGKLKKIDKKTIKSDWTDTTVKNNYGPLTIGGIGSGVMAAVTAFNDKVKNAEVDMGSTASIKDLIGILKELFNLQGAYDQALAANVSVASLYSDVPMTEDQKAAKKLVETIATFMSACEEFADSCGKGKVDLKSAIKAVIEFGKTIVTFIEALVDACTQTIGTILSWVEEAKQAGDPKGWIRYFYDKAILYGYGVYNMPNRTTIGEEGVYGYGFEDIYKLGSGKSGYKKKASTENFTALADIDDTAGSDGMFYGAETEYLLVGSKSEKMNQATAFVNIFLLRTVLDIGPVFLDTEIGTMTSPLGTWAIAAKLIIALGEGYVDSIILANGGSEPIWKGQIYLSPSGVADLIEDLMEVIELESNLKDKLKKTLEGDKEKDKKDGNGETKTEDESKKGDETKTEDESKKGDETKTEDESKKGDETKGNGDNENDADKKKKKDWFSITYSEYMLLLLVTRMKTDVYMKRVRNIIQMETAKKHKNDYTFKLDNAYTYFKADITYQINPMLPADGLTENGLFTFTTSQRVGY